MFSLRAVPLSALGKRQRRMSETLSLDEVARRLGISVRTAQRQARSGSLAGVPVIRIGRIYRVPAHLFEQLIQTGQITTPAA